MVTTSQFHIVVNKPYAAYTVEELTLDDLFVRWVQHPTDDEVAAYWQNWLEQNPACTNRIETARRLVEEGSQASDPALSTDEVSTVWGRIRESLQGLDDLRPLQPDVRAVVGWWYFFRTVAAVLSVLVLLGWALWMQYGPNQSLSTVRTAVGQTRQVQLPDKSMVVLHPNSTVQFASQWTGETPRAVWLDGEADFSVVHRLDTTAGRVFRVHVKNLTIEATGTVFQVRRHAKSTCVALTSGRINLVMEKQKTVLLRSGDSYEIETEPIKPFSAYNTFPTN